MAPPKSKRPPCVRPLFTKHARKQMAARRYSREAVTQIFEEYWLHAVLQDDVLRPGEPPWQDNRLVLMVEQNGLHHRIHFAFVPIFDCLGHPVHPVEASILTVIFEGTNPPLPDCPFVALGGSYDLPDRDWEKQP